MGFWDSFFEFLFFFQLNLHEYRTLWFRRTREKFSRFPLENTSREIKREITQCDYENEKNKTKTKKQIFAHKIIGPNEEQKHSILLFFLGIPYWYIYDSVCIVKSFVLVVWKKIMWCFLSELYSTQYFKLLLLAVQMAPHPEPSVMLSSLPSHP